MRSKRLELFDKSANDGSESPPAYRAHRSLGKPSCYRLSEADEERIKGRVPEGLRVQGSGERIVKLAFKAEGLKGALNIRGAQFRLNGEQGR